MNDLPILQHVQHLQTNNYQFQPLASYTCHNLTCLDAHICCASLAACVGMDYFSLKCPESSLPCDEECPVNEYCCPLTGLCMTYVSAISKCRNTEFYDTEQWFTEPPTRNQTWKKHRKLK